MYFFMQMSDYVPEEKKRKQKKEGREKKTKNKGTTEEEKSVKICKFPRILRV